MEGVKKPRGLLDGIRILDLADERVSFCSKLLADLGAFVIKVEKPEGDATRSLGPFRRLPAHRLKSLSFLYKNTNKCGITLDIEHEEGRALLLRLVEHVDVIVETFPPGYLQGMGLSFERLLDTNARIILASVSGFGQGGPKSRWKSCDLVAAATGGQMFVSGSPSKPPLRAFGEQSYCSSSLFAAVGILLALHGRRRNGKGTHLDLSMQESVAATLEHVFVRYFDKGEIPGRQGARHWDNGFFILPCKDGFIQMTLFQNWETLVGWLDSEGMAEDLTEESWRDEAFRTSHVDHVIEVLRKWTKTHLVEELFERAQAMRMPWAPVQSPGAVVRSPQLRARGFFAPSQKRGTDTAAVVLGMPYRFSRTFESTQKHAPEIGEDNERIYKGILGLSNEELERLHSLGVI